MDWKSTRYLKIPAIKAQERKDLSKRVLSDTCLQMKRVACVCTRTKHFLRFLAKRGTEREIFPLLLRNERNELLPERPNKIRDS